MPTQGGQTARPYQEVSPCNGGTFTGLLYNLGGALSKGGAENVLFYYPLYIQPGGLLVKGKWCEVRGGRWETVVAGTVISKGMYNLQIYNLQFTIWLRHVAKSVANSK